jgi:ribosomal protein S18 acetylase RimI-like enzyme
MTGTEIRIASSSADYAAFGELITQYVNWCRLRYQDDVWFVNEVFGHQSLDTELSNLERAYGPPQGVAFLALRDGRICGAGAYRKLSDDSCEMKRLFVPDEFHGMGIGRALCRQIVEAARAAGFAFIRLDTARRLTEAIGLYAHQGFRECPPYYEYPDPLKPYLIFMELDLRVASKSAAASR